MASATMATWTQMLWYRSATDNEVKQQQGAEDLAGGGSVLGSKDTAVSVLCVTSISPPAAPPPGPAHNFLVANHLIKT